MSEKQTEGRVSSGKDSSVEQEASHFERLGGRVGVSLIIDDFIDRVTSDLMIGFFFRHVNKDRLKQLELEFACGHLGGPQEYSGRALHTAHGPHRIMGGQFNRRLRILEQTLSDHNVPTEVAAHWLAHNESLRANITLDGPFACNGQLPSRAEGETPS